MLEIIKNLFYFEGKGVCSTCYALKSEKGILLIDAGNGSINFPFKPIMCILTHLHEDHSRGAENDWEIYANDIGENYPFKYVPKNTKKFDFSKLEWGDFELEIIPTPGHTPDGISLFEKKNKLLFSGDNIFPEGFVGRVDLGGNEKQLQESIKKLKELKYKWLLSGHGFERVE